MSDLSDALSKLGLKKGLIVEVIVSSMDSRGYPNAAPMGLRRVGEEYLEFTPYKNTKTYLNVKESGYAVINVVSDLELFYLTAFKRNGLRMDLFDWTQSNLPYLKEADAFLETRVEEFFDLGDRVRFKLRVLRISVLKRFPKAFCRCDYAVLESLIHATRIIYWLKRGEHLKVKRLMELFKYYKELVNRICPKTTHSKIMSMIEDDLKFLGGEFSE